MTTGIYKITNPNNSVYIGQSVNIENRFYRYKILSSNVKGQTILYRSFLKYGVENHKFEILQSCSECDLNHMERYYQELYNSVDKGLNCVLTKTSDKSGKVSKETLERIRQSQIGNNNWLGKNHSQESKDKIREKAIGRRFSKEVNMSKGRKGRVPNRPYPISKNHHRSVSVNQYKGTELVRKWECLSDVKKELNYNIGNISSCINGRLKTYRGFTWQKVTICN